MEETHPAKEIFHLFEPVFKRLDIALWRTAFLGNLDIGAIVLICHAIGALAIVHGRAIATNLETLEVVGVIYNQETTPIGGTSDIGACISQQVRGQGATKPRRDGHGQTQKPKWVVSI
jgi:hypothetical protein